MINCEPTVLPAFRLGTKGYNTYHVSRLLSREYVHVAPQVVTLISNPHHALSSNVDIGVVTQLRKLTNMVFWIK